MLQDEQLFNALSVSPKGEQHPQKASYPPGNTAVLAFAFQISLHPTAELLAIMGRIHSVPNW